MGVLGTRLCMGSLFIGVTPPGIIQFDAAESVFVVHHLLRGQTGEGVTVWWGTAEEEGTRQ